MAPVPAAARLFSVLPLSNIIASVDAWIGNPALYGIFVDSWVDENGFIVGYGVCG
jgi:hypothetical protein